MSEQVQKNEEIESEKVRQEEIVVQRKLYSIISVWISFVILYFAVNSGSEAFMLAGLALTAATSFYLYAKN